MCKLRSKNYSYLCALVVFRFFPLCVQFEAVFEIDIALINFIKSE